MTYEPVGGIRSDHVRYRPSMDEIELIGKVGPHYYEIWEGLPDVDFKDVTDRAGRAALRFDSDGHYIWVPSNSTEAYDRNKQTLFFVFMNTSSRDKIRAWWVSTGDGDLDYLIERAKGFNEEKIVDGRRIAYDEEAKIEADRRRRIEEEKRDEELKKRKGDREKKNKMDKWW